MDVAKLSMAIGIERLTVLKYFQYLEDACFIRRLFTNLATVGDLQKPDKILVDNPNLIYVLSTVPP